MQTFCWWAGSAMSAGAMSAGAMWLRLGDEGIRRLSARIDNSQGADQALMGLLFA